MEIFSGSPQWCASVGRGGGKTHLLRATSPSEDILSWDSSSQGCFFTNYIPSAGTSDLEKLNYYWVFCLIQVKGHFDQVDKPAKTQNETLIVKEIRPHKYDWSVIYIDALITLVFVHSAVVCLVNAKNGINTLGLQPSKMDGQSSPERMKSQTSYDLGQKKDDQSLVANTTPLLLLLPPTPSVFINMVSNQKRWELRSIWTEQFNFSWATESMVK